MNTQQQNQTNKAMVEWTPEMMLEVQLKNRDAFLIIMETLTRIGVISRNPEKDKKDALVQTCHILEKDGKYYLMHFREMFALEGMKTEIPEIDIARRNGIAELLEDWELLSIVEPEKVDFSTLSSITIISSERKRAKEFWLKSNYRMKYPLQKEAA